MIVHSGYSTIIEALWLKVLIKKKMKKKINWCKLLKGESKEEYRNKLQDVVRKCADLKIFCYMKIG